MAATITQGTTTVSFVYDSEHKRISQSSTVAGTTTTTAYLNDPASGSMEEIVVSGSTVSWRDYLVADGAIIGVRTASETGGPLWGSVVWNSFNWAAPTITWAYFVLDHLGSVAVVTDASGTVTQRLSYDPWGKERNPDGSDAACGSISSPTTRGFTNQEQLDQVCLVNLNARIYDPSIGKFLSPDPIVGNPFIPNAFNRYAYVLNNPLSLTDPTGLHCEICSILGLILDVAVLFIAPVLEGVTGGLGGLFAGAASFDLGSIGILTANAAIAGAASAGVSGGDVLKGLEFGALGGALAGGLGAPLSAALASTVGQTAAAFVGQGFAGGITSQVEGGNFGAGFLAAGVGSLAGAVSQGDFDVGKIVLSAALGGVASVLGGGKFENGAVTAAFAYAAANILSNSSQTSGQQQSGTRSRTIPATAGWHTSPTHRALLSTPSTTTMAISAV